jgi:hypothetical protein
VLGKTLSERSAPGRFDFVKDTLGPLFVVGGFVDEVLDLIGEREGVLEKGHGLELEVPKLVLFKVVPSRGEGVDDSVCLQGGGVEEIDEELVGMVTVKVGQSGVDDGIGAEVMVCLVDDREEVHVG